MKRLYRNVKNMKRFQLIKNVYQMLICKLYSNVIFVYVSVTLKKRLYGNVKNEAFSTDQKRLTNVYVQRYYNLKDLITFL